jgi:hypothetical protein
VQYGSGEFDRSRLRKGWTVCRVSGRLVVWAYEVLKKSALVGFGIDYARVKIVMRDFG